MLAPRIYIGAYTHRPIVSRDIVPQHAKFHYGCSTGYISARAGILSCRRDEPTIPGGGDRLVKRTKWFKHLGGPELVLGGVVPFEALVTCDSLVRSRDTK